MQADITEKNTNRWKAETLIGIRLLIAGHISAEISEMYQVTQWNRLEKHNLTIIEMFSLKPSIIKDHSLLLLISVRKTLKVFYDIYANIYIISMIMISTQNV